MEIIPVNNRKTSREFVRVPKILYKDDPVWVCPLDKDIRAIFNPDENVYFRHGEASRWVMKDQNGRLSGRMRFCKRITRRCG